MIFIFFFFLSSVGAEKYEKECGFDTVVFNNKEGSFATAQAYCRSLGLNVIRIDNSEQDKCIRDVTKKKKISRYWIDGTDVKTEGIWLDSDNNKLKYTNWYQGQPNNYGGTDNCIAVYYSDYLYYWWWDVKCTDTFGIVCSCNTHSNCRLSSDSAVPSYISTVKASLKTLSFSWTKSKDSVELGRKTYYLAQLVKDSSKRISENVSDTSVEFNNLDMCSKYCFEIVAVNEGGQSESSGQTCSYTLAPTPGSVIINAVGRLPSLNNIISWTYSGNNDCPIYYKVEYGLKYTSFTDIVETKDKHIVVKDLERNMLYKVRVKAETKVKVENDLQYGPYSEIVYFYTGREKPTIEDYREDIYSLKRQFNISWNLDSSSDGSVFEFIVIMKNSSKSCLTVVNLVCTSCNSQYSKINLQDADKVKRKALLNCQIKEAIYYKDNENHFRVSLNLNELSRDSLMEIFAINLAGVHKVQSKVVSYEGKSLGLCKVRDIESGPFTSRKISWTYSGKEDSVYYQVEYQAKYTEEIYLRKINNTSITLDNLEKNMIYQVRVRAERRSSVRGDIEEGYYSDIVEFFTGKERIQITNAKLYLGLSRKNLDILWSLEEPASGSVQSFMVRVNNTVDTCLSSITFVFQPFMDIRKQTLVSQHLIKKWQSLSKCTHSLKKNFTIFREDFSVSITSSEVLDNYTLSIYGLNVLGIHKLYEKVLAQ